MDFWETICEQELGQGDLLPDCIVPDVPLGFWMGNDIDLECLSTRLIVITQSCDLIETQEPVALVILCRVYTIDEYVPGEWSGNKKRKMEAIRKGRNPKLHLLGSTDEPDNPRAALVVDFRETFTLPRAYLVQHANNLGDRCRLLSSYREHFSQAFARYFMRVGLPSDIPRFT